MSESSELRFAPVHTSAQVGQVAALAAHIWREYYVALIGTAQVEYMIAKFQSAAALAQQIAAGDEYFMIERGSRLVGYLAVRAAVTERMLFISKLYLEREQRGVGGGRRALQFIERLARERGLERLWLTVNKHNQAVRAYEKCGFVIAASITIDIGAGFVMDDFRMEKGLDLREFVTSNVPEVTQG